MEFFLNYCGTLLTVKLSVIQQIQKREAVVQLV